MKLQRVALLSLIASVALSAAMGVYALLAGDFGDVEIKVLLTSLTISAASILAMACAPAWERRKLLLVPQAGVGLSLSASAACVLGIWVEVDSEFYWKTTLTAAFFGIAAAHVCLLSLARLEARYKPAAWAGSVCAVLLALMLSTLICTESFNEEWWWRSMGVVSILLTALTIAVPILHRISALPFEGAELLPDRIRACPACGASKDEEPGELNCKSCGARVRVEFLPDPASGTES